MRISEAEKKAIEAKSKEYGFSSVSAYVKYVALNAEVKVEVKQKRGEPKVNAITKGSIVLYQNEHGTLYQIKGYTMKNIYENMTEWEQRKALYLQQVALDLHIELDDMIEIGVNQSSGYTYLFSYDLPFVLYMPISCELTKQDVWVMTTDNMTGEEYERTLCDATQSDLEIWSYKMTA